MLKSIFNLNKLLYTIQKPYYLSCYSSNVCEESNVDSKIMDDPQHDRKIKILTLEMDVARQEGRKAPNPELLKPKHWEHILSLTTRSARSKYYSFLWTNEKKDENEKIKKEITRNARIEKNKILEEENKANNHIIYSLMHTSFLLRIYDSTINHWDNNKLIRAMRFGQPLIYDCSYDEYMSTREATNAAKQLMLVFAENRFHNNPFDLHFCNVNKSQTTMKYLHKHIPTMYDPEFPLNIHEKSYLDLFPKERLVYLTPHCNKELIEYNHDDIYIVGAMVDKINNEPLSLGKAKKLGLRMAKLPLDRYLQWGGGSGKSLTLNQMCTILLNQKDNNDWNDSLKAVPRRKLVHEQQHNRHLDLERYKFNADSYSKPKSVTVNKK